MAEFLPHYDDGDNVTFAAGAAITGGQVVEVTGNMQVGPTAAASSKVAGVAARDAASGANVMVYSEGVFDLLAVGAIAAGDIVVSAAGGGIATIGANTFDKVIGRALEAIANGATGRVRLSIA